MKKKKAKPIVKLVYKKPRKPRPIMSLSCEHCEENLQWRAEWLEPKELYPLRDWIIDALKYLEAK